MIYLSLFIEFFSIGLFAVGGGLATLPFLYRLGERSGWFNATMIADMIAVSESTPGAIGINMATFAGFTVSGVAGALAATLGLILPSIIIISIIAHYLERFRKSVTVQAVFSGLRPAALGLIAAAGAGIIILALGNPDAPVWYQMFRWKESLLFAGIFLLMKLTGKHPVWFILAGALAGIGLGL